MKPEVAERLFIEELFEKSRDKIGDKSDILNIDRLTGDASTRRYYRAYTKKSTYVICIDNPTEEDSNFVKIQTLLNKEKITVPQIYDKNLQKGYLLEEDLGDVTLLQGLSDIAQSEELNVYKKVIDELVKLHKLSNKREEFEEIITEKFNYEKLKFEINFTVKYFLKLYLGCEDEKILDKVSNLFGPLCIRLSEEKMVLTHRDFHSRNIMLKDKRFILIDFQDARWGIPQYDLASILDDCYYDLSSETRGELKTYYYDQMKDQIDQSRDKFDALYVDMAIQRVFKAVGSFCYIYDKRKDERYLKYIGFAMEKLKRYMMSNKKYNELRKILFGLYYES